MKNCFLPLNSHFSLAAKWSASQQNICKLVAAKSMTDADVEALEKRAQDAKHSGSICTVVA